MKEKMMDLYNMNYMRVDTWQSKMIFDLRKFGKTVIGALPEVTEKYGKNYAQKWLIDFLFENKIDFEIYRSGAGLCFKLPPEDVENEIILV